ncbi:MAG: phosphoribosylformylglycinamidine synthase subunit PurS, partial [Planctomycetota bacterium]
MKQWRFEVFNKSGFSDVHGMSVLDDIGELGIASVQVVQSAKVFLIEADFDKAFAERVGRELLTDPVCEQYYVGRSGAPAGLARATLIEVHLKSGVTDPVAESVRAAVADMGVEAGNVRTARKYVLLGQITDSQTQTIAKKLLANDCIEDCIIGNEEEPPSPHLRPYELQITRWPICELDDEGLMALSKQKDLFLNLIEMQTIQSYYRQIDRDPTDIELESIAQTWSEHCVHKTLKSSVDMSVDGQQVYFEDLLKETVFKATTQLNKDWCISVFADNAGVVDFDEDSAVCFKVETHNHPSALDPYGGAATGIGGVMVAGVRDYGNRMGIPTVNGAIYFDDRYLANPLVYCGNIGLMDKAKCFKNPQSGNLIIMVGGRIGRDGIHGATFSSGQMTHEHETVFSHAVQIGNPITEKKMLDVLIQANEAGLYEAITDCGAGGLSSAVGEMGENLGAEMDLEKAPLKYAGLSYTEIWISEAQERMVVAVKPENLEAITKIFDGENVESTVIGRFTDDRKLKLRHNGQLVGELDMEF